MRSFLLLLLSLLCASRVLAQSDAGAPQVTAGEPTVGGGDVKLPEPGAEFRWQAPPEVGTCIGGSCGIVPRAQVFGQPVPAPSGKPPTVDPRQRFANTGAVLGLVSAGLVLGSSIAIAVADDLDSERVTRGVWVSYFAVSTGIVALSAHLGHRALGGSSSKAARGLGWTAFALALADGAILWAGAFQGYEDVDLLTIGAGVIGACALLPHALDAYVAGRGLRARSMVSLEPSASGLRVRF
ncbi:MAG TPA: hypothetical protein VFX59_26780 [Polyangiales bacterium]|nr:hypothetical protein [Polyangiales bacterium]